MGEIDARKGACVSGENNRRGHGWRALERYGNRNRGGLHWLLQKPFSP